MHYDTVGNLEIIWAALHGYREDCIPEGEPSYDDQWGDICGAMAQVRDELFCEEYLSKKLAEKHGTWGEIKGFPRQDWITEVSNRDTNLGYWQWAATKLQEIENLK